MERLELGLGERRVLGVLIEKSLTTPSAYPLTLNAIVTGCNQKSNRDPVASYVDEQVEDILARLRERGLATVIYPAGARTEKWRQELTSVLDLDGRSKAVIAELLLRGPQTIGQLRARASRMKPIPDLDDLRQVMEELLGREPPLLVRLSADEARRGVRVTHNLYPEAELKTVLAAERELPAEGAAASSRGSARSPAGTALSAITEELADLRRRVEALEERISQRGGP